MALAQLGVSFLQAADSEISQTTPANQPLPAQIQPTNRASFSSAAEAQAQAQAVSDWMEMVRSKREEPQVRMRIHDAGATAQGGAHRLDDVILGYSLNSVEQFVVFRERFELPAAKPGSGRE